METNQAIVKASEQTNEAIGRLTDRVDCVQTKQANMEQSLSTLSIDMSRLHDRLDLMHLESTIEEPASTKNDTAKQPASFSSSEPRIRST